MPRIKVTRCILALTVISLLGFLSLSLWMESSRRSKSDEDYINLLFKATLSPNFHHRSPSNNTTQTSSSSTGIGENIEKTKRKKMTLFSPEEVQEFWASFTTRRPWFMKNGEVRPDPANPSFHSLPLWPSEDPDSDRIINQLMYIPSNYKEAKSDGKLKKIFLFHGRSERSNLGLPLGRKQFLLDECPVNTCELTIDPQDIEEADAIYFKVNMMIDRSFINYAFLLLICLYKLLPLCLFRLPCTVPFFTEHYTPYKLFHRAVSFMLYGMISIRAKGEPRIK